ncbi:MAG: ParB/RepB/Spo0J family partition protein [Oscillospiraceae bacterium]|nr:ParB/RepB/Spo0J family partition protein [Oscillospiraceae bacterium]
MPRNKTNGNLALVGYDDIFKNSTTPLNGEAVFEIPLDELNPPEFHPFQVNDDESMKRLTENIKRYGVREPGLARPREDGGYELLCGNRRKRACELAGIPTMPVIIREMDDDSAAIAMVDSNLEQREKLLYSEKAWAYRIKLEALNHNGVKGDMLSVDVLSEQTGESKNQIFRLVRLTELVLALLDKVDAKQLAFNPAVELSYLSQVEQTVAASAMDKYGIKPSLSQAVRLKKMKKDGTLTIETIDAILSEGKKPTKGEPASSMRFRKYFPPEYSQKQMDAVIVDLLKNWKAGATV